MQFPTKYKCLSQNEFHKGDFKIIPIRFEDRIDIMNWRNEQIHHLRQVKPLTEKSQEHYFNGSVVMLFDQEKPNQILFSYLKNGMCIGYGGLVHINWIDKNAEISFVLKTNITQNDFTINWRNYLKLIEKVAFQELKLKKIFTYAFDIRPQIYPIFENSGFEREAELKNHCYVENEFKSVIIHSKINKKIKN
tara:strand:+ start:473 stop:1048 length:576 start_codon:yes stop_codon:yes gene_type:complete